MLDSEIIKARENDFLLEQVLTEYKPLVCLVARRYFLIGAELEDLIQEGMVGLYKAIRSFDINKNATFRTFATLCITSQIQTAVKANNRNKNKILNEIILEDNQDLMYLVVSSEQNPEDRIINKENFDNIKSEIVSKLTPLEKQILKQYLKGKNYQQIADCLKIDKKSVDNGLIRIRKKLIHLL